MLQLNQIMDKDLVKLRWKNKLFHLGVRLN